MDELLGARAYGHRADGEVKFGRSLEWSGEEADREAVGVWQRLWGAVRLQGSWSGRSTRRY